MAGKKARRKKNGLRKSGRIRAKPQSKKRVPRRSGKKRRGRRRAAARGRASAGVLVAYEQRGLGARSGGQSGDTQGLSGTATFDSESVEELLEEGQSFEAEVLNGVETARDPDEAEVITREVVEDDVPTEYLDGE
jgi:hypothetical protein